MVENDNDRVELKETPSLDEQTKKELIETATSANLEQELQTGIRTVSTNKYGKVEIRFPTIRIDSDANKIYTDYFTRLFKEGKYLTFREMTKTLASRGIWGEDEEKELNLLRTRLTNKSLDLADFNKLSDEAKEKIKDKIEIITSEISAARMSIFNLAFQKANLYENTIEKKAEKMALLYKVQQCVINIESNELIWKSVDELIDDRHPDSQRILNECVSMWQGIDIPLFGSWLGDLIGS